MYIYIYQPNLSINPFYLFINLSLPDLNMLVKVEGMEKSLGSGTASNTLYQHRTNPYLNK